MRVVDPAQMFSRLSTNDKIRFLSRFGWELTVVSRDADEPRTEESTFPSRLRAINEIQHRILSHLYSLASDCSERYPEDVLIAILLEAGEDPVLNEKVQRAFDQAAEFLEKHPR